MWAGRERSIAGRGAAMLNGKRYFAAFPDEEAGSSERLLSIAKRLEKLAALEKELRRYLEQNLKTDSKQA
jgi:hypothetical protein